MAALEDDPLETWDGESQDNQFFQAKTILFFFPGMCSWNLHRKMIKI